MISIYHRWTAAFCFLGAGIGYAALLTASPAPDRTPSPQALRALAERLESERLASRAAALSVPRLAASPTPRLHPSKPEERGAPKSSPAAQLSAPDNAPADAEPSAPHSTATGAEDAVKNIALMGVTRTDGEEQAWLVDLATQEREILDPGGEAWGFVLKDVLPEEVVLARGSQEFTLRLGEKEIPVVNAPPPPVAPPARTAVTTTRAGRGSRRQRFRPVTARGPQRSRRRSSNGNRNRGQRSASNRGRNAASRARSFNPATARAGSGFYGNRSQFSSTSAGPTSNPQTARRRGGRLIGGAPAIETPATIRNPQTVRRLGTNSLGPAFGNRGSNGSRRR